MSRIAVIAALALLVAGCIALPAGLSPSPAPSPEPTTAAAPSTTPEASATVSRTASPSPVLPPDSGDSDPALDDPEHEWVADPVKRFVNYGERHADQFGGLYLDGPTVVMMFTDDLDKHEQNLAEVSRGRPVRVVPCRYTRAALDTLMMSLVDDFKALLSADTQPLSLGVDTINNVVKLEAKSDDPTLKERLEAPHGGMLVVNVYPMPGPWANVESGDGWRLLFADSRRGGDSAYTIQLAVDEPAWLRLWEQLGVEDDAPSVDFATELVAVFRHGIGSSCPELRLDDVVINRQSLIVYTVTSDPLEPRMCTADLAGSADFAVALNRARLPDRFTLRLRHPAICVDCLAEPEIEVELRP